MHFRIANPVLIQAFGKANNMVKLHVSANVLAIYFSEEKVLKECESRVLFLLILFCCNIPKCFGNLLVIADFQISQTQMVTVNVFVVFYKLGQAERILSLFLFL